MHQMDRLIMIEREKVLKQADQKMTKIERTTMGSLTLQLMPVWLIRSGKVVIARIEAA